jgi:putative ABC transport system ATP-binding protein
LIFDRSLFDWVLKSHRWQQLVLFLMIVLMVFLRIFPLEMQKRVVNIAIQLKQLDTLYVYCALYLGAVVVAGVLKFVVNALQAYIGQKVLLKIRNQLYEHILLLPLPFFRKTPPGMVISSLTSELSVIGDFLGGAIAVPLINVLTLVTFAGYMFHLNPLLAVLSMSIYPLEIAIIPALQKRLNRLNFERIDTVRSMSNVIGEAVSGMQEVHANAGYSLEKRKFGGFSETLFHLRNRMNILKNGIKFVNSFFQSLGPFLLFLVGGWLSIKGRLDLGALVAFLSAYEKLYDPWRELMDYYQDYQDSQVRYKRIMEYFHERPEFAVEPVGRDPYPLDGRIEMQNLSFTVDNGIRLLDQVSMKIDPGSQVALVGLSGSGKSTLAMVIGQIYSYNGGRVLVDGKELRTLTKMDVVSNMGYVAQQPFIFDGSLLDNLVYACDSIREYDRGGRECAPPSPSQVLQAISMVGLSDDILRFGLNTVLSPTHPIGAVEEIVRFRNRFHSKWGAALADSVEFFDYRRYLYHSSVAVNVTFGTPNRDEYKYHVLHQNPKFQEIVEESGLMRPLVVLGQDLAAQTVILLGDLIEDPFFVRQSPIPPNRLDHYRDLVERTSGMNADDLERADRDSFLLLALRFTPAVHTMAAFPEGLPSLIFRTRFHFIERITKEEPEAFTFYRDNNYLFNETILGNILFGKLKSDAPHAMEEVQQRVAELLDGESLHASLMGLGMEFQVGSKGDRLSGGQKQKIAIARALLKNPSILILDEATASLDNASQARIQHLIDSDLKGKCTVISVAHRLSTIESYDQIAVMRAGKVIELGAYDELLARKGLFYELINGTKEAAL